jgi:hypothetical protein
MIVMRAFNQNPLVKVINFYFSLSLKMGKMSLDLFFRFLRVIYISRTR